MTKFEKECVDFVSGYMDAGVSAEDYVKTFAERLLGVAKEELISRQIVKAESVTEIPKDLGEAAAEYSQKVSGGHNYRDLRVGFIAGAKWQAKQDQETIELAEDHAYLAGAVNEREKMMKEAVEGEVTETCGISSVWIKTKQFKPGQKVKIIIVKED